MSKGEETAIALGICGEPSRCCRRQRGAKSSAPRSRDEIVCMRLRLLLATISAATAALMPQIPLSGRFTAGTAAEPRVAPDEARANCLLDAWFADSEIQAAAAIGAVQKSERLTYGSDPFHGTLCWAEGLNPPQPGVPRPPAVPRPGVLLVHGGRPARPLLAVEGAETRGVRLRGAHRRHAGRRRRLRLGARVVARAARAVLGGRHA